VSTIFFRDHLLPLIRKERGVEDDDEEREEEEEKGERRGQKLTTNISIINLEVGFQLSISL
jgi:hypothetical protein